MTERDLSEMQLIREWEAKRSYASVPLTEARAVLKETEQDNASYLSPEGTTRVASKSAHELRSLEFETEEVRERSVNPEALLQANMINKCYLNQSLFPLRAYQSPIWRMHESATLFEDRVRWWKSGRSRGLLRWLLTLVIGAVTALVAVVITWITTLFFEVKFTASDEALRSLGPVGGFLVFLCFNVFYVFCANRRSYTSLTLRAMCHHCVHPHSLADVERRFLRSLTRNGAAGADGSGFWSARNEDVPEWRRGSAPRPRKDTLHKSGGRSAVCSGRAAMRQGRANAAYRRRSRGGREPGEVEHVWFRHFVLEVSRLPERQGEARFCGVRCRGRGGGRVWGAQ